jgi:arylsulfatase A-like enzyme
MHGGMRLLPHFTSLAEVLNNIGFKTTAFHSNPFLSKSLGWGRGFKEFYDFMDVLQSPSAFVTRQKSKISLNKLVNVLSTVLMANRSTTIQRLLKKLYYRSSGLAIPYLEGEVLNRYVFRWIEKNKSKKFFLWIHYMDPHYPYIPPEPYLPNFSSRLKAFTFNLSVDYERLSKEEVNILRDLYCGEVKYVDACIGDLLNFLEDRALLDDSLILLLADHGHAFMEHGRFGHAYDILYNEVLHVPLIFHGLEASKKVNVPVQLLDVPPTITDMLNVEKPASFRGESLIPVIKGDKPKMPIISESAKPDLINLKYDTSKKAISYMTGKWKLIINEMLNSIELYNTELDFEEKINLAATERDKVKELRLLVQKHLSVQKLLYV